MVTPIELDLSTTNCTSGCHSCVDCCGCDDEQEAAAAQLRRWAWGLTALTIGWNTLEAVVAIISGIMARSIALVGFGLDSVVEVTSALVVVWRLRAQGNDDEANERAEQRAVRLIALSFFAIAIYVSYDALARLTGSTAQPEPTVLGISITAASLIVMPLLVWAKRRIASQLNSAALQADAAQTKICTYLSVVVLVGLGANALLGWWWMDSLAGLVVAGLAIREGHAAWMSGDLCCDSEPASQVICLPSCCPTCPALAGA